MPMAQTTTALYAPASATIRHNRAVAALSGQHRLEDNSHLVGDAASVLCTGGTPVERMPPMRRLQENEPRRPMWGAHGRANHESPASSPPALLSQSMGGHVPQVEGEPNVARAALPLRGEVGAQLRGGMTFATCASASRVKLAARLTPTRRCAATSPSRGR